VLRANFEDTATFPSVADVEVAVEVCPGTQERDLGPKLDTYAREGVPVYWAVMPESPGWLVVHRRPVGGTYYSVERIDLGHGYLSIDATLVERYAEPLA
jgi:Uma2 family endonuclease